MGLFVYTEVASVQKTRSYKTYIGKARQEFIKHFEEANGCTFAGRYWKKICASKKGKGSLKGRVLFLLQKYTVHIIKGKDS